MINMKNILTADFAFSLASKKNIPIQNGTRKPMHATTRTNMILEDIALDVTALSKDVSTYVFCDTLQRLYEIIVFSLINLRLIYFSNNVFLQMFVQHFHQSWYK